MALENYYGRELTFKVPSGATVTIREQNGDDDDTLSTINSKSDQSEMVKNINKFVASVMVKHSEIPVITYDSVLSMLIRDKHFILLKSRIHSLGNEVKFKMDCIDPDCGITNSYIEDLNLYDNDFTEEPKEDDFEFKAQPYKNLNPEKVREFDLSSGKKIRYKHFDGAAELFALELGKNSISKNSEFLVRNLEIFDEGKWHKVGSFGIFSPRDMAELRADLIKYDSQFVLASKCVCPECKNEMLIPFIQIKDFFFPLEPMNT